MLGGGSAEWRGSGSNSTKDNKNPTAFPVEIVAGDFVEASNLMGLTAHPSEDNKNQQPKFILQGIIQQHMEPV